MPPSYGTTARYALRKLFGTNLISDIDSGIGALADDVDGKFAGYSQGVLSSRPVSTSGSPGVTGRLYYSTDTGRLYVDLGTSWLEIPIGPTRDIPSVLTSLDQVPLHPQHVTIGAVAISNTGDLNNNEQAAVLVYIPRRIVSATRIRWKYRHDATACTGNYVISIHDLAGVKIRDTGSVAFTGAASSVQVRAETITATTFEAGLYYALIGATISAGSCITLGARMLADTGTPTDVPSPLQPNIGLRSATGGVTAPANLSAFTDIGATTTQFQTGVPLLTLSVG